MAATIFPPPEATDAEVSTGVTGDSYISPRRLATALSGEVTAASNFSADNRLLRSDGTGKALQDSALTVADTTGALSGFASGSGITFSGGGTVTGASGAVTVTPASGQAVLLMRKVYTPYDNGGFYITDASGASPLSSFTQGSSTLTINNTETGGIVLSAGNASGPVVIKSGNATALTLDSSQNIIAENGVFKSKTGVNAYFRTGTSGQGISLASATGAATFDADATFAGTTITGSNASSGLTITTSGPGQSLSLNAQSGAVVVRANLTNDGGNTYDFGSSNRGWKNIWQSRDAIATTSTDGTIMQNTTAATSGTTVQMSPRLRFRGTAWDTSASETVDFFIENLPASAATPTGTLKFGYSLNGAAATYPMTLSSAGALTYNNFIVSSGQINGGSLFLSSGGRIYAGDTASNSLKLVNVNADKGVNLDFSTDDTLALKKRSNSAQDAAITAGAGTFSGNVSTTSVRGTAVTFANVPASPVEGMMVAVTDSSTNTWGATITGGGSNHVLAYYNGTNWTVAAK